MFGLGRGYTAIVTQSGITTASDLIRIVAPSDGILVIDGVTVTTNGTASQPMQVQAGRATGGGTASSVTPEQHEAGDAAFGGDAYDLTGDTDSTLTDIVKRETMDVRSGFYWEPKIGFVIPPDGIFTVRHALLLTTGVDMEVVVDFREIG